MIFHCSTQLTADIIIKPQHFIFSSGEGSRQCQYYIQYYVTSNNNAIWDIEAHSYFLL